MDPFWWSYFGRVGNPKMIKYEMMMIINLSDRDARVNHIWDGYIYYYILYIYYIYYISKDMG